VTVMRWEGTVDPGQVLPVKSVRVASELDDRCRRFQGDCNVIPC
jgi:hypothetical protein